MSRSLKLATFLVCASLASAAPRPIVDDAPDAMPKRPKVSVAHRHSHRSEGVWCTTVSLLAWRVKDAKVRLHVISNGERRTAQSLTVSWAQQDWPDWADGVRVQVMILEQAGRPFGAKDVTRISMTASAQFNAGSPAGSPHVEEDGDAAMISRELEPHVGFGLRSSGDPGEEFIFYESKLGPPGGGGSAVSSGTLDEMTKRSSKSPEAVFWAATVEWSTFE